MNTSPHLTLSFERYSLLISLVFISLFESKDAILNNVACVLHAFDSARKKFECSIGATLLSGDATRAVELTPQIRQTTQTSTFEPGLAVIYCRRALRDEPNNGCEED